MKWIIFDKIIPLIFFGYCFYLSEIYNNEKIKRIIIEVDVSVISLGGGPTNFIKGIHHFLPYKTRKCKFIVSKKKFPYGMKKSNYYFFPFPKFNESIYNSWVKLEKNNKLILGPIFVPEFWTLFPDIKIWKERRFSEILEQVKGIAVHSKRVRDYLSIRSNTTNLLQKFKIIRPCTNINPKNINPFIKRYI